MIKVRIKLHKGYDTPHTPIGYEHHYIDGKLPNIPNRGDIVYFDFNKLAKTISKRCDCMEYQGYLNHTHDNLLLENVNTVHSVEYNMGLDYVIIFITKTDDEY
jgi:hypothetical protein